MQSLVRVNFVDEYKLRSSVGPDSNSEQAPKTSRRETLVEHLGRGEQNIRRFGQHTFSRDADLVRVDRFTAPCIDAHQTFQSALDVRLSPTHGRATSRAAHEWTLVPSTPTAGDTRPGIKLPGQHFLSVIG